LADSSIAASYKFAPQPDWAQLPSEIQLGDVAGIAVGRQDRVYLFNRGAHPVVVLDKSGEFLTSWGHGVFENAHGAYIGPDDAIYLTDNGDHTVRKFTLDGKLLLQIGEPKKPSPFMSNQPFCRCTHCALAPNGDIYVSDGYGNAAIHKFSPDGKLLFSWGTPGTGPGEFNLPHNICCDADGWVYVADRENDRVQIFDGNGKFETQIVNMHRPSALAITSRHGPDCIVGELMSYLNVNRLTPNLGPRVSVFAQTGELLGRIDPKKGPGLQAAEFVSPHSIALDSSGDMYVGEVAATDWAAVFPDTPHPGQLGRFQKFMRVAG
jgi:streptogramin lyase